MKGTKWSNAWIFREYWEHCWASPAGLRRAISEGKGRDLIGRWVSRVQSVRRELLEGMKDAEGLVVLRSLKDRWYGQLDGPGWERLQEEAVTAGRTLGEDAYLWIAEWAIRTHGPPVDEKNRWYRAVLMPTEEFRQFKVQVLHWRKTENAEYPWECITKDCQSLVRIGDFPIDHLYYISRDGKEIGVTDDWPSNWTRESWLSSGCGATQAIRSGRRHASTANRDEQVDRIIEKVGRLREMDLGCALFGSNVHKYCLGPPLSGIELQEFEKRLGVEVPPEYRLFLMRAGHGGAGPYYGLFRLGGEDPEDITDLNQLQKQFRWDEGFNPYNWDDPCSQEDVWCQELEQDEIEEGAESQVMLRVPGALYVCDCGCGIRCFMPVQGKRIGEVWCDSQADGGGINPECGASGEHLGFLDWYEKWLDEGIAAILSRR